MWFYNLRYFPKKTLSLGWTTSFVPGTRYSRSHVDEMSSVLKSHNLTFESGDRKVTFPVRAALLGGGPETVTSFRYLLELVGPMSSLTVWSSPGDELKEVKDLSDFIESVGQHRIYLDVPKELEERILKTLALPKKKKTKPQL